MDYLLTYEIRKDDNFRHRLIVACVTSAQVILNEGAGVAKHAARVRWANLVLAEPGVQAERMAWAVLGNAAIKAAVDALPTGATLNQVSTAVTDVMIQAAVDALIAQFAPDPTTASVADGTYTVGAAITVGTGKTGTITIANGLITAIQQAN